VISWFEANRTAIDDGTMQKTTVTNLNVPTCPTGTVRGVRLVDPARDPEGYNLPPNCESDVQDPSNDIAAYVYGFASLAQVSAKPAA
jgi:hypothetical protein